MTIIFRLGLFFLITGNIILASSPPSPYFFIENKGQWPEEVLFRADVPGGKLYIQKNSMRYSFYDSKEIQEKHHARITETRSNAKAVNKDLIQSHALLINFLNASSASKVEAEQEKKASYNFFSGKQNVGKAKSYESISIENIYENINYELYSKGNQLKYDIVVEAGGNAKDIVMSYEGADEIVLRNGSLYIKTTVNTLIEQKPFAYQLDGEDTVKVECQYHLKDNQVSFLFPRGFDRKKALVIDPLLIFSTFSGSFSDNWGFTATYGEAGTLYSGGIVFNPGFPVTIGAYQTSYSGNIDIGLIKFDSTGSEIIYGTFLGGSFSEVPHSLLIDDNENLIVLGTTSSLDFPMVNAFDATFNGGNPIQPVGSVIYPNGSDIFVAKFNKEGSVLLGSTYLGGSNNDGINNQFNPLTKNYGDQFRGDVISDSENNIYIATNTQSADILIVNGVQSSFAGGTHDGIIYKLNKDLNQVVWNTYLGGANTDGAYSIKLGKDNSVFVAGGTNSASFPVTTGTLNPLYKGGIDGYVVNITADGSSVLSGTFLGTSNYDQAYFLDIDKDENVYVYGQTKGSYPISPNVYYNPNGGQFVHKLNKSLTKTVFSTVFGFANGAIINPNISPTAFLASECENIYAAGWSSSVNAAVENGISTGYIGGSTSGLPVTPDAIQKTTNGADFYLLVLSKNADKLLYATFFGGNDQFEHVDGGTSRFDKKGIVYHVVCAGCRATSSFTTTADAYSRTNNSTNCNMASFKFDLSTVDAAFQIVEKQGCNLPFTISLNNTSSGGANYLWDFGDGTTSTDYEITSHVYTKPGQYTITLQASNAEDCGGKTDIASQSINVYTTNFEVGPHGKICEGENYQLSSSGGVSYKWVPENGLNNPSIANPLATPQVTTKYLVKITDEHSCIHLDSITVTVLEDVEVDFESSYSADCKNNPVFQFTNNSQFANTYYWDFGDGTTSTEVSPIHEFPKDSIYQVKLIGTNELCTSSKIIPIAVVKTFVPNVFTPNQDDKNDYFQIKSLEPVDLKVFNRWGFEVFSKDDYQNDWNGDDLPSGIYYYSLTDKKNNQCKGWVQLLR